MAVGVDQTGNDDRFGGINDPSVSLWRTATHRSDVGEQPVFDQDRTRLIDAVSSIHGDHNTALEQIAAHAQSSLFITAARAVSSSGGSMMFTAGDRDPADASRSGR